MSENRSRFENIVTSIPKTEIHLHLEGLATPDTIWKLIQKNKVHVPGVSTKKDLIEKYNVTSLDEFIKLFIDVIQNCFQEVNDLEYLFVDAKNYLKRNNIVYTEIFFAPSKFLLNGLAFEGMMKILDKGAKTLFKEEKISIRFLIDVSRTIGVENAEKNLELTLNNRPDSVIGIGLGGAERRGPAREFQKIFEKARKNNLHVVAHAGEDIGPESIWEAINFLHVSRIGHGISAIQDKKLMDYLRDHKIPLEICPTSNIFTQRYVKKIEEHPIKPFYDHGIEVTVNTDDPSLFQVDLIEEYMKLYTCGLFNEDEIIDIIKKGIEATFLPEPEKKKLLKAVSEKTVHNPNLQQT
jgi:adenosine deaminase